MGYNQWDMPFTSNGLVPGLILNPHAIPSRMTIGQLIEGLVGKVAAHEGSFKDATIFKMEDLEAVGDLLEKYGYDRYGVEHCYNGFTGEPIDKQLFITPTYYQRLQKFVIDEVYSVSSGPTCLITRQPVDGKANKGGLRIGEMEQAVLIVHGSGHFLMEKFRDDSDDFTIYVCRTCGKRAAVNEQENIMICNTCNKSKMNPDFIKARSAWSSKLFMQECESCNIGIKLGVAPFEYEVQT